MYEAAMALTAERLVPQGLYERTVTVLGRESITDMSLYMRIANDELLAPIPDLPDSIALQASAPRRAVGPRSGTYTEYLLLRPTNVRWSFMDNAAAPASFWLGSNHARASCVWNRWIRRKRHMPCPIMPTKLGSFRGMTMGRT